VYDAENSMPRFSVTKGFKNKASFCVIPAEAGIHFNV